MPASVGELISFIERWAERGDFTGFQSDESIQEAERALGLRFPPSYRAFVARFGAGNLGAQEFCGLTPFGNGFPDVVWYTLRLRSKGLPVELVPVENSGVGVVHCLDTSRADDAGEVPVVRWVLDLPIREQDLRPTDASFADFALRLLRELAEDEHW